MNEAKARYYIHNLIYDLSINSIEKEIWNYVRKINHDEIYNLIRNYNLASNSLHVSTKKPKNQRVLEKLL